MSNSKTSIDLFMVKFNVVFGGSIELKTNKTINYNAKRFDTDDDDV